ncbi:hypothetical protein M0804_003820 [Polistes exclamans]|nr:hypothetical protein M0804_003820 [Polistes exclamans]
MRSFSQGIGKAKVRWCYAAAAVAWRRCSGRGYEEEEEEEEEAKAKNEDEERGREGWGVVGWCSKARKEASGNVDGYAVDGGSNSGAGSGWWSAKTEFMTVTD